MRVGVFTSSYLPTVGGIQYFLNWLLTAMDAEYQKKGIEQIVLIAPTRNETEFCNFKSINVVECHKSPRTKISLLLLISRLVYFSRQYSLDLLHCNTVLPEGLCCWIAKYFTGVPFVITCHGVDIAIDRNFNYGDRLSPIRAFLTKHVLRNASLVTTISSPMVKYAVEAGADNKRVKLIPNGIDTAIPSLDPEVANYEKKIKELFSIQSHHRIYLTLSGMRKIKGHNPLIRAFAKAVEINSNLRLFIGAHGAETESLKSLVGSLGMQQYVSFIGFVTGGQKKAWFNLVHVYCNTAFFEPFGLVYLEAILHRVAVLGSVFGGGRDIFEHKKNAYLVDPNSLSEITEGILTLSNDSCRAELVRSAELLLPRYDMRKIADEYLNLYLSLAKADH